MVVRSTAVAAIRAGGLAMFQRVQSRSLLRTAMACALAGVVVMIGAIGPACAEDEDDELPDVKVMRKVMRGLGLKRGDEADIEYRERSPLVVPPTTELPRPEDPTLAERNPAWPDDPDVRNRKQAATKKKRSADWVDEGRAMRPDELNKGVPRGGPAPGQAQAKTAEESARQSTPSELGFRGFNFDNMRSLFGFTPKEERGSFEREPARTSLTQPPPGYLTPSPDQPYGVGKTIEKPKAFDPVDQAVGSDR